MDGVGRVVESELGQNGGRRRGGGEGEGGQKPLGRIRCCIFDSITSTTPNYSYYHLPVIRIDSKVTQVPRVQRNHSITTTSNRFIFFPLPSLSISSTQVGSVLSPETSTGTRRS